LSWHIPDQHHKDLYCRSISKSHIRMFQPSQVLQFHYLKKMLRLSTLFILQWSYVLMLFSYF
jgi:hypothetical protein